MTTVAILGFQGFVGNSLFREFQKYSSIQLFGVNRENFYDSDISRMAFDYLIHSANPAKRFIANSNPEQDRINTIDKTKLITKQFRFKKMLLISTISSRLAPNTPYGKNRMICEQLVQQTANASVIRLGPMYGGMRENDTLHDIVHERDVHFSEDTKYSYASVEWIAHYIGSNLEYFQEPLYEIGASNYITLGEIAKYIGSKSRFVGKNDDQIILRFSKGPDARQILPFARSLQQELRYE